MGVTHPSREECGRGLMLMFHSNSKMSTLIFVLFVSVKNVETLTTTIQAARFFFSPPYLFLIHPALQYRCHCSTCCGCFHIHSLTSRPPDRSGCRSISPGSLCVLFMTCPCWLGSYSASKSWVRFNLGSIHCPDCWPLITSEVHRCWISVGALCQSCLANSANINHR